MPPSNPKSKASSSSTATDLSQGAYPLHLAHPSARSTSVRASFMPVYARFQPILGTQKCFPRDFRDQFSIFPKIFWIRGLFFKNMSRISGGAKSRFCPVAGGVGCCVAVAVSCLPAVWVCARCPVSGGRSGSLRAKKGGRCPGVDHSGPARCRSAGDFWPCLAIVIRDFWPGSISGPVGPLFCPLAGFLSPCGPLYLRPFSGPLWGLLWAVVGWVGLPAGVRCLFGAKGVPGLLLSACL